MENISVPSQDIEKNKELAALSYLWIFSLIILVARRDSTFIQFHARQGVVLFLLSVLLWPFDFLRYGEIVILALMILGFIQAAMGNTNRVPVIGDIAEGKFGLSDVREALHFIKHTAIRMVKPEHVTPSFKKEADNQYRQETTHQNTSEISPENELMEREEKKLSVLFHRVEDQDNKIHELEDEVHLLNTKINTHE
ncbi:hypothetical protein COY07_00435 [Candidatus Peregrinibacteria bacterium CG_4_10_14_0_2_um_filter_43_11]|nr:MAG: hypothetical protein COY07_00435 [Candidatus Peregrinibacteria bacterium CG_4_10_14_0_2_um_filter_43_11]